MSAAYEWLNLIEVSGPFLAEPVLRQTLPDGLDVLPKGVAPRLRSAYDEWREAVDDRDPQLDRLHAAWIEEVLTQALEYDDSTLLHGDGLPKTVSIDLPEHGTTLCPDMVLVEPARRDTPVMLVTVTEPGADLDASTRRDGYVASPKERMVTLLRGTGCQLGLVTNGEAWTLVHAPEGTVASYSTWYARMFGLERDTLRAFASLLGIHRFTGPANERLPALFERSLQHQGDVTEALGDQVAQAIEVLMRALDRADQDRNRDLLKDVAPKRLYEAGLTLMMRLVVILSAEERDLLLLGDPIYDEHYAITSMRSQLLGADPAVLATRQEAWSRLLAIFRLVFAGSDHPDLRLPALGGSLFDPDRFPFLEGRQRGSKWREDPASPLPIDDRTVLLLLDAIQIFRGRTLSYKALDVEQIGHVYEGLLDQTVGRVDSVTLQLKGSSRVRTPLVSLAKLEEARDAGTDALVELVTQSTERSEGAIRNDLTTSPDNDDVGRLLTSCRGDEELRDRILPFVRLLDDDPWGMPLVHQAGAIVIVKGTDRRESGSHYTPKSLTEKIVEETLTPIVYRGPAEGVDRKDWELKRPAEILELKICDPAMGSGAFLVQVCRWLGDRLVEAWAAAEADGQWVDSEGVVHEVSDSILDPMPGDTEERSIEARRLIAERCLYGVDMNPLAVELAKLSLWLTTVAKGRPFGFLDHNLRHGDSLLGINDLDQVIELRMDPKSSGQLRLFGRSIEKAVGEAIQLRKELRAHPVRDIEDIIKVERIDERSRRVLELTGLVADAFIECAISQDSKRSLNVAINELASLADEAADGDLSSVKKLKKLARRDLLEDASGSLPRKLFHWPLEYPEVFNRENAGFDAFVGNPPYVNAVVQSEANNHKKIKKFRSKNYTSTKGSYDLYVIFLERAIMLCSNKGTIGYIVPNKILSAEYAEELRKFLIETSDIHLIIDYSSIRVFTASVYPIVIVLRRMRTGVDALVSTAKKEDCRRVKQAAFAGAPSFLWGYLLTDYSAVVADALQATVSLGKIASVSGAATVSEAYEIIPAIEEAMHDCMPENFRKFIVSGNVRPFCSTWESAPVQYLKTRYSKPIVNLEMIPKKRREQAQKTKIVISGMAKRPVAFLDTNGDYLSGKSTVIVFDPISGTSLEDIVIMLNSKLGALIYLGLYGGLALSGGYLRFGPPQISGFPIPTAIQLNTFEGVSPEALEVKVCEAYSVDPTQVESAFHRHFVEG